MKIKKLKNKKILILGFGKEGKNTLIFLRKLFPDKKIMVADKVEKSIPDKKNLELFWGDNYLKAIPFSDVIFKTPGIPLNKIRPLIKKGQIVTSQDRLFLENCPGTIIGITGTKGKGTTASLAHNILKKGGRNSYLVGNIGEPRLTYLDKAQPQDIFIQEFSARQLQLVKNSPHISVFLNFYQAHLDYYKSLKEYKKAKQKITLFQKKEDYLIYNKDQEEVRTIAQKTKAEKISFSLKSKADCRLQDKTLVWRGKSIIKREQVPLLGDFNLYNVMAAISIGKLLAIKNSAIKKGIEEFKPLPHRLERVGKYKEIVFYNDSLATLPEPVIAALNSLSHRVQTLILGGYEAHQNFQKLAKTITKLNIENVVLFPPTGERIKKRINQAGGRDINFLETKSMKKAVRFCFVNTKKGKIVLLSPAAPSFGVFKNYKDRGEQFKKWVKHYGQQKKS